MSDAETDIDTEAEIETGAETERSLPPTGSLALSEVIAKFEQAEDVLAILEVEWEEEDGFWEVEYVDTDNNSATAAVDPMTGERLPEAA